MTVSKIQGHVSDNRNLLKEVNNMRHEIRTLLMENHHLKAQLDTAAARQKRLESRGVMSAVRCAIPLHSCNRVIRYRNHF